MATEVLCDGCRIFRVCKPWNGCFWCVDCFPKAATRRAS